MKELFCLANFLIFTLVLLYPKDAFAIVNPLAVPNNKFGIHIITASKDEASPAASLVNSNGDWGYITVLMESKDRDQGKWQAFFDDLRRWHLIPLVRLATKPNGGFWERPTEGEEKLWADFLDSLNWPVKNRYVIVYNEPNHAKEWGNEVDAKLYAETLDKTITALKNKNRDFFVLNAGFDASAPSQQPAYEDEVNFLKQMNEAVPGIFNKLDGWASHSYPNPGFVGSPFATGRTSVNAWLWETRVLRGLGLTKDLPVFITETGWKHAEGLKYDPYLPTAETVGDYYKSAFEQVWNSDRIAAVTPFLLNYQEAPFDHFSFKKITGETQNAKILGVEYPEYYPQYQLLAQVPKNKGKPIQDNKAELTEGEIFSSVVAGEVYDVFLTFKNTGQSIWNDMDSVKLVPIQGGQELGISGVEIPNGQKIEPGRTYTFKLKTKAPNKGVVKTKLNLYAGGKAFDSGPVEFITEVKPPVILQIKASLKWKKDFEGNYLLSIKGPSGDIAKEVELDENGSSEAFEARFLLPDYAFEFTLERWSEDQGQTVLTYKPVTIRQTMGTGLNIIDFGELNPVLLGNLTRPRTLWSVLPFSN